jgi:hypothetical protein
MFYLQLINSISLNIFNIINYRYFTMDQKDTMSKDGIFIIKISITSENINNHFTIRIKPHRYRI